MKENAKWVQTWGQSHSALSLFTYPSAKKTYRLVVNTAISGKKLRLALSNSYGKDDVKIDTVSAAPCDSTGYVSGVFKRLNFDGHGSFTLRKGERVTSDPVDFEISAGRFFCVSIYVTEGDLTSGNLLDSATLITAKGDKAFNGVCNDEARPRDTVRAVAGKLLGMHLPRPIPLFDSIELLNDDGATSIVVFGDSISQQGFWTNPFEKRIREAYPGRYSLINKSVMGNRLLFDCSPIFPARGLYGRRATGRLQEDVINYSGIEYVIFELGVNDIFEYASINALPSEKPDVEALCAAMKSVVDELHKKGVKVIGFNIPAFGSAPDATPEKDALRLKVNAWLAENSDMFEGFFDVSAAATDPNNPYQSVPEWIGPDKLHPNALGGEILAGLVDLEIFRPAAPKEEPKEEIKEEAAPKKAKKAKTAKKK